MKMMNLNARISQQIYEDFKRLWGKPSQGAERACLGYLELRKYALNEIKGIFSKEEISAMVDAQNGLIMETVFMANKGILIAHLEDADKFEGICEKWYIDKDLLISKINNLTSAQVFFLRDEIDIFWRSEGSNAYGSPNPDLNKLFDRLC